MRQIYSLNPIQSPLAALVALLALSAGCGTSPTGSLRSELNSCEPGAALILVGDDGLDRRCGCTEAARRFVTPTTGFTCTIARGTSVVFNFSSTLLQHQILSTGTPSFASSGIYLPGNLNSIQSHAVTFATPGTYSFQDAFVAGSAGQLIVQ